MEKKNIKVVNGEMFIVPNSIWCESNEPMRGMDWIANEVSKFGIQADESDQYVQIWACGDGNDNWTDHGKEFNGIRFPGRIPLRLIDHLKEGDTLKIEIDGYEINLVAAQLKYRYRRFGKFEEVLSMLKDNI